VGDNSQHPQETILMSSKEGQKMSLYDALPVEERLSAANQRFEIQSLTIRI